jgi:putative FmdB family regulatory protein
MPTYDYRCRDCGDEIKIQLSINDPAPLCAACGRPMEAMIIVAPAYHGRMARGREQAMRCLEASSSGGGHVHGPGCGCGANRLTV